MGAWRRNRVVTHKVGTGTPGVKRPVSRSPGERRRGPGPTPLRGVNGSRTLRLTALW